MTTYQPSTEIITYVPSLGTCVPPYSKIHAVSIQKLIEWFIISHSVDNTGLQEWIVRNGILHRGTVVGSSSNITGTIISSSKLSVRLVLLTSGGVGRLMGGTLTGGGGG